MDKELYDIEDIIEKPFTNESEDDPNEQMEEVKEEDLAVDETKPNLATYQGSRKDPSSAFIEVKTGISHPMMKNPPFHIKDAEEFEPLYTPRDNILEDCLRWEAERVAH